MANATHSLRLFVGTGTNSFVSGCREHAVARRLQSYESIKRLLDVIGAVVGLIVLIPLFATIAALIKLTDWGPILFVQTRVGKDGQRFRFYKFRSMVPQAERIQGEIRGRSLHTDPRTFKIVDDPRITWIGRLLRRSSMDELPQLWNVLRGEMSLVGPRPPLPSEVDLYSEHDWRRLHVTPGLTCLWQIRGRGRLPFSEQLKLDVEYIERRSLWLDIKLLCLTVPAVLSGRGAY